MRPAEQCAIRIPGTVGSGHNSLMSLDQDMFPRCNACILTVRVRAKYQIGEQIARDLSKIVSRNKMATERAIARDVIYQKLV